MKAKDYEREELLEMLRELIKQEAMDGFYEFYGHMTKREFIKAIENF